MTVRLHRRRWRRTPTRRSAPRKRYDFRALLRVAMLEAQLARMGAADDDPVAQEMRGEIARINAWLAGESG